MNYSIAQRKLAARYIGVRAKEAFLFGELLNCTFPVSDDSLVIPDSCRQVLCSPFSKNPRRQVAAGLVPYVVRSVLLRPARLSSGASSVRLNTALGPTAERARHHRSIDDGEGFAGLRCQWPLIDYKLATFPK